MRWSNHETRRKSKQREVVALLVLSLFVKGPIPSQHRFTAGQVLTLLGTLGRVLTVSKLHLRVPQLCSIVCNWIPCITILVSEQALLPGIAMSSMAEPGPPTSLASGTVSNSYKGRVEGVVSKWLLHEHCYCGWSEGAGGVCTPLYVYGNWVKHPRF